MDLRAEKVSLKEAMGFNGRGAGWNLVDFYALCTIPLDRTGWLFRFNGLRVF